MIVSFLVFTFMKGWLGEVWIRLAVWLGVIGWALHCFMEFELYIPALSWLVFALMGWLLRRMRKSKVTTCKDHQL